MLWFLGWNKLPRYFAITSHLIFIDWRWPITRVQNSTLLQVVGCPIVRTLSLEEILMWPIAHRITEYKRNSAHNDLV
jgi:hypothetical protein